MRLPLGSTDVTPSGGTVTLIGRRGEGWESIAAQPIPLADAAAMLETEWETPTFGGAVGEPDGDGPFWQPGQEITWHYGRTVDTARVVQDDARGLVIWIPSGAEGVVAVPEGGQHLRDVPLDQRFSTSWVMRRKQWHGSGVVRVAPTGKPWSVWFFRNADGSYSGAYVNLELPHRRPAADDAVPHRSHSRDLVLDLWVDADHEGNEDVWLKDADELDAAVEQGRVTATQREAVRAIADHACQELLASWSWPMNQGWQHWQPTPELDAPISLPDNEITAWSLNRSGDTA